MFSIQSIILFKISSGDYEEIISEARLKFCKKIFICPKITKQIFHSQEGGNLAAAEKAPKTCVVRIRISYDQTMKLVLDLRFNMGVKCSFGLAIESKKEF